MDYFIYTVLAWPLVALTKATGDYALSLLLFLVALRITFSLFDYMRTKSMIRSKLARPYVAKIKDKFLGKDAKSFENATLEVFKVTKTSQWSKFVPYLIEYPLILLVYRMIVHPVQVFFPNMVSHLDTMCETGGISGVFSEMSLIHKIQESPSLFSGFDTTGIDAFNTKLFGVIDLYQPAAWGNISLVFPVLIMAFFVFKTVQVLLPAIQGKKTFKEVGIGAGLMFVFGCLISSSVFVSPVFTYVYLLVFLVVGGISMWFWDRIMAKRMKDWLVRTDAECKTILQSYGVEDMVEVLSRDVTEKM